jgi:hypothetical protein
MGAVFEGALVAPVDWVPTYFDCSRPTASRWVAAAKDTGYLRVTSWMKRGLMTYMGRIG